MTVALDATVSGGTANSYVASIAEALVLMDASPYLAAFLERADEDSESASTQTRFLLRAMDTLDTLGFPGYATTTSQALQHPRANMPHPSGWQWDAFAIAAPIKRAQALLAAWLASRTETDPSVSVATTSSDQTLKELVVGPIDITFDTSRSATTGSATTAQDDYLDRVIVPLLAAQGLVEADGGTVRLTR